MFELLALVAVSVTSSVSDRTADQTFYVAPDGNDSWSGKLAEPNTGKSDGPLATLAHARDMARKEVQGEVKRVDMGGAWTHRFEKKGLKYSVKVVVRGGKYFLKEPFVLDKRDSGTRGLPIVYTAYPGERPILSGGREIEGWRPYKKNIWQASISSAKGGKWKFRQLFFNGKRQIRARVPNYDSQDPVYGGWAYPQLVDGGRSVVFGYEPGTLPRDWDKPTEAEVRIINGNGLTDTVGLKSIDKKNRHLTLLHRIKDYSAQPYAFYEGPDYHATIGPGYYFYVENILEELDRPGEWCLDSEEGILYFWPPEGSLKSAEIVAPALSTLVDFRGVSYIHFSGFELTETVNGGENMHRGGQEGYGATYPTVGRKYCGEAVHFIGAENCLLEHNLIREVGGNGIYIEGYNERNTIRANEIGYAGSMGICAIGSQYNNPKVPKRYPIYNRVEDNHIHHCGFFDKYSVAIFLGVSQSNIVSHNQIDDVPWIGIQTGESGFGRNIFEYNVIRRTGLFSCDKGAIHTWMEDPYGHVQKDAPRCGHIIRYNLITDSENRALNPGGKLVPCAFSHAIYLDNYSSNCTVYGNISKGGGCIGVYVQGGQNNMIENNIIIDSIAATNFGGWWQPQMEGFMTGNHYTRNIFYRTAAVPTESEGKIGEKQPRSSGMPTIIHRHIAYAVEPLSDALGVSDYNVFYSTVGGGFVIEASSGTLTPWENSERPFPTWPQFVDIPLKEWRKMGFDTHSVIADPLFVDIEKEDFRVRPDSPALDLGFQQIDARKMGPRIQPGLFVKPEAELSSR